MMASESPSPACDQLPPRTTRGQWHDSPGVIPNPRCHGKWEVVQQAMFDYQRQIHFKHVQTIGMPTDQTISKMLLDQQPQLIREKWTGNIRKPCKMGSVHEHNEGITRDQSQKQ